ncbi:DMT family transporter [uncultured Parasutterella sp.]|uniref:DMT family transporter n=2 Tax=uncultured Parasutterella sp. TaxID=1263098 RepID=UPI00262FB352|nr:DMT family transporter [uncultured Parasutterella sp.]
MNRGPLLILLGALCFSTSGTFQSFAPNGATPFTITEVRMFIGSLGLFFWCLATNSLNLSWKNIRWKYILLVAVSLLLFQWLFFSSTLKIGVAVGTIIAIGSTPIWTAIIEWLFFSKTPSRRWCLSTLLAVVGIIALNWQSIGSGISPIYSFLPLLAGFAYACEIIFSKKAMENASAEVVMMFVMLFVALINLPTLFFFSLDWVFSLRGAFVALGLGLVTATLAFSFFFSGARTTSAAVASTLGMMEPLGAAVWGILLLHEPCGLLVFVGISLILISIFILIEKN